MTRPFALTRDEVRELDRRAINDFGVPGIVLMENAGRGCAELLMRLNPNRMPTVILCGPGNNGGDGFVIARHLDNHRFPVWVWMFAKVDQLPTDAAINFRIAERIRSGLIQAGPGLSTQRAVDLLTATHLNHQSWIV